MIKSPLRYPGGKSRALKQIIPHVPEFREYREPFLGGGSVFVRLRQLYPDCRFKVNDLYPELYHFWSKIQDEPVVVIALVRKWKLEYKDGKELYRYLVKNLKGFTPLQKAAAFFILNRLTFSGTSESGGFSKQAFEKRFTESSIVRAENLSTILTENVQITNQDFSEIINEEGKEVFIFLDPPYFSASKAGLYGKNGNMHKGFDHKRFAETMKNCSHKWLITYDNSKYIRELFDFAHIYTWELTYGMRNVGDAGKQREKEIFISNYELNA
ncbi:MAG: DNA adenine methylase [Saprospiraceae bacterium]|jgi:DNA adenine methylase